MMKIHHLFLALWPAVGATRLSDAGQAEGHLLMDEQSSGGDALPGNVTRFSKVDTPVFRAAEEPGKSIMRRATDLQSLARAISLQAARDYLQGVGIIMSVNNEEAAMVETALIQSGIPENKLDWTFYSRRFRIRVALTKKQILERLCEGRQAANYCHWDDADELMDKIRGSTVAEINTQFQPELKPKGDEVRLFVTAMQLTSTTQEDFEKDGAVLDRAEASLTEVGLRVAKNPRFKHNYLVVERIPGAIWKNVFQRTKAAWEGNGHEAVGRRAIRALCTGLAKAGSPFCSESS